METHPPYTKQDLPSPLPPAHPVPFLHASALHGYGVPLFTPHPIPLKVRGSTTRPGKIHRILSNCIKLYEYLNFSYWTSRKTKARSNVVQRSKWWKEFQGSPRRMIRRKVSQKDPELLLEHPDFYEMVSPSSLSGQVPWFLLHSVFLCPLPSEDCVAFILTACGSASETPVLPGHQL